MTTDPCPTCRGTGIVPHTGRGEDGYDPCPDCEDDGQGAGEWCNDPECRGVARHKVGDHYEMFRPR